MLTEDSWVKWLEHISTCDAAHCRNANTLRLAMVQWGMDPPTFLIKSDTDGTHIVRPGQP